VATHNLGDDRSGEDVLPVELSNKRAGDPRLVRTHRKDRGPVLVASVRPLAVELCRVMGDREIDL
jgi:hypothetical protein